MTHERGIEAAHKNLYDHNPSISGGLCQKIVHNVVRDYLQASGLSAQLETQKARIAELEYKIKGAEAALGRDV